MSDPFELKVTPEMEKQFQKDVANMAASFREVADAVAANGFQRDLQMLADGLTTVVELFTRGMTPEELAALEEWEDEE